MIFFASCLLALIVVCALGVRPFIGLCLFLASIPFTEILPKVPFFGSATSFIGILTLGFYLIHFFMQLKPIRTIPKALIFLAIGFLAACTLSVIFSRVQSINNLMTYLQLFIMFLLVTQLVRTQKEIHWLMATWVGAILLVIVLGVFHYDISQISRTNRFAGATANANLMAYYCNISAWFLIYFFFKTRRVLSKAFLLGLLFLDLFAVLISFSRTGFIVLGASALFAVYLLWKHLSRRIGWICIAVIAFLLLLSQFNLSFLSRDISSIPKLLAGANVRDNSFSDRTHLWMLWINQWSQSPFFGLGIGATLSGEILMINIPHNSFISILVETGILGLTLFLGLILTAWKYLFRLARAASDQAGISLAQIWLLAFFIWNITSLTNSQHYDKILFVILGMIVVLGRAPFASFHRHPARGK